MSCMQYWPRGKVQLGGIIHRRDELSSRGNDLTHRRTTRSREAGPSVHHASLLTVIIPGKRITKNGLNINMLKKGGEGQG